jgi:hypothetical protein
MSVLPTRIAQPTMSALVQPIARAAFFDFATREPTRFLDEIAANRVFVVKEAFPRAQIAEFRRFLEGFRRVQPASWHPCVDGCPDYHRINDEYPKSYVRAKMRSYYLHRWNAHAERFSGFKDIFSLKNLLAGEPPDAHFDAIPSQEIISRLVSNQYPRGGGYLAEHIDPVSPFAKIQTIILASDLGDEYSEGGLYMKTDDGATHFLDPHARSGDLLVLSPAVRHGVAPIDPDAPLDWERSDGRWMILPIIIRSDYNMDPATKPRMAETAS